MRKRGAVKTLWLPDAGWFWDRVDKAGECWLWLRQRNPSGYGMVRHPGSANTRAPFATLVASRVAWALEHGPIPEGLLVLHRCDNRACVRPSHLFLGDDKANMDDMHQKERGHKARGERQHLAKLTEAAVRDIRAARAKSPPTPLKELAERHGVSLVAVSMVALGKTWMHVR